MKKRFSHIPSYKYAPLHINPIGRGDVMGSAVMIAIKTAVTAVLWLLTYYMPCSKEKIKSFCAGFCFAEAVTGLCGRCSWMYSVVFGERLGFVMLAATAVGALLLFELLSGEHSSSMLTALYIFFSSAESEYISAGAPIINLTVQGLRTGAVGLNEAISRRWMLPLAAAIAGNAASLMNTRLPAAFAAISCCALLHCAVKNFVPERSSLLGAALACLLAYF